MKIDRFEESRTQLRPFFEMADDSAVEIDTYIDAGEVFVARSGDEIVGHIQAMATPFGWEIRSISVLEDWRRQGIGAALVRFVLDLAAAERCARVVVGTAAVDSGAILFYERIGFRFERIERDVFTSERGYPSNYVEGIPLRDRVWLSIDVALEPIRDLGEPE